MSSSGRPLRPKEIAECQKLLGEIAEVIKTLVGSSETKSIVPVYWVVEQALDGVRTQLGKRLRKLIVREHKLRDHLLALKGFYGC